jgi:hypothetical protein
MGKTVVKQSDVDLLYDRLITSEIVQDVFLDTKEEFEKIVDEVFGVDISDIPEKENK